jgi:CRP/FNR family transcriptional regulator
MTYLHIQQKCEGCGMRNEHYFCEVSQPALAELQKLKITNAYSAHATLFSEGQPADGIFVLCQGRVKLSSCSADGKVVIMHIAKAGELLGTGEVIAGGNYETSAEAIEPVQANFIAKADFNRLLKTSPELAMKSIHQLSGRYMDSCEQLRTFVLAGSVADKLAQLLLSWSVDNRETADDDSVRFEMHFTHEEIAEMLGTSRETVTRILKEFRQRGLITLNRSDLRVNSIAALRRPVGRLRRNGDK